MERELRAYLIDIEAAQFAKSKTMAVSHPRSPDIGVDSGDCSFHAASGRIEVVYYIYGRSFFHPGAGAQKPHHVAREVEVAASYILNLDYQCIEPLQIFLTELYVVGSGSEFCAFGLEQLNQITPLLEDIVKIPSGSRIEAILGTETTHAAL